LTQPAGVITFTYTGEALWLLLAPGDYWASLYATVDGQPANRLPSFPGAAGYTTLLAPEVAALPAAERLRWVEVHRAAPGAQAEQSARLEFWRGWGQTPLRGVAVDPPAEALYAQGARRPLLAAPLWPGALLLLGGLGLAGVWLVMTLRLRWAAPPSPGWFTVFHRAPRRVAWLAGGIGAAGATLLVVGTATSRWPLALAGVALLGAVGVLRPASWFAALLFALPFAYAVTLPLLPRRALGVIDVGLAGGVAVLAGHALLRWLTGAPPLPLRAPLVRPQRLALLLLALVVGWALAASLDVRYPALALREWRTLFLNPLLFAGLLVLLLRRAEDVAASRQVLVIGWLLGAATVAAIGLWGYATGAAFVSAAEGVRRVQALYDSANNLALYLDRTLAVSLALALFVRSGRARLLWALLAALQGLAWLLTFSKGSLLLAAPALLTVLGVGGFWLLRRQGRAVTPLLVLAGGALAGGIMLAPFIGAERFQRLLDFEQGTGFLRLQLWRSAWQMALDHPLLGVGPDHFLYHYRSGYLLPEAWQEPNLNHPHNLLLDWWTRLGLPGLALGLAWLAAGVWSIVHWLRTSVTRPQPAALALGSLAAAAAGLAHGLIDVSYALPELMIVWVLLFHLGESTVRSEST
jgi:O-antigen ligase